MFLFFKMVWALKNKFPSPTSCWGGGRISAGNIFKIILSKLPAWLVISGCFTCTEMSERGSLAVRHLQRDYEYYFQQRKKGQKTKWNKQKLTWTKPKTKSVCRPFICSASPELEHTICPGKHGGSFTDANTHRIHHTHTPVNQHIAAAHAFTLLWEHTNKHTCTNINRTSSAAAQLHPSFHNMTVPSRSPPAANHAHLFSVSLSEQMVWITIISLLTDHNPLEHK